MPIKAAFIQNLLLPAPEEHRGSHSLDTPTRSNSEIDRRIQAGKDYSDLLPEGLPLESIDQYLPLPPPVPSSDSPSSRHSQPTAATHRPSPAPPAPPPPRTDRPATKPHPSTLRAAPALAPTSNPAWRSSATSRNPAVPLPDHSAIKQQLVALEAERVQVRSPKHLRFNTCSPFQVVFLGVAEGERKREGGWGGGRLRRGRMETEEGREREWASYSHLVAPRNVGNCRRGS